MLIFLQVVKKVGVKTIIIVQSDRAIWTFFIWRKGKFLKRLNKFALNLWVFFSKF